MVNVDGGTCVSDWLCVYYTNKINQGKTFTHVSTYVYFEEEDKNLSDEDALWETIVDFGTLTEEAQLNNRFNCIK